MRKIAGPGHVSNRFVDYDAATNPDGTVYTADYGNDVQDELVGIQDEFSIPEAAGTNEYIKAAIIGMAIKYGKALGELFYLDSEKSPSAYDKDNPDDFFPGLCLDNISGHTDIASANWPDLVTHLRAKTLKVGSTTSFDVTNWDITANVATLTLSGTEETDILTALAEDALVNDEHAATPYTDWRSVTLPSAIGDIAAGEYALTDVDPSGLTISFAYVASNNSGSVSAVVNFYENRIPGSTTTARVYQASGRTLVSPNDENDKNISGLRMRDAMQRITGNTNFRGTSADTDLFISTNGVFNKGSSLGTPIGIQGSGDNRADAVLEFDSADSTSPNTAKTDDDETRPKSLNGHLYLWGRSYSV